MKAVRVDESKTLPKLGTPATSGLELRTETMKSLAKLIIAVVFLTTAFAAHAGWVNGYYRSNGTYVTPYYRSDYGSMGNGSSYGYVYRNPYAAYPSVSVRGYYRADGTFVAPYRRTAPNNTTTDNLNYRGYGMIRVPRY